MSSAASKSNLCGPSEPAGQYESGATQPYLQPVDDTVDEPRPQLTTSDCMYGSPHSNRDSKSGAPPASLVLSAILQSRQPRNEGTKFNTIHQHDGHPVCSSEDQASLPTFERPLYSRASSSLKTRRTRDLRQPYPKFGCPYRKRNPTRFNIRSHKLCAMRSYSSLSSLK